MTDPSPPKGCGWGCVAILGGMLVMIAVISITALIDPFAWMPPVAEILAATGVLVALGGAVSELRESRPTRFESETAAHRYGEARDGVATLAMLSGLIAALPIIVALV